MDHDSTIAGSAPDSVNDALLKAVAAWVAARLEIFATDAAAKHMPALWGRLGSAETQLHKLGCGILDGRLTESGDANSQTLVRQNL